MSCVYFLLLLHITHTYTLFSSFIYYIFIYIINNNMCFSTISHIILYIYTIRSIMYIYLLLLKTPHYYSSSLYIYIYIYFLRSNCSFRGSSLFFVVFILLHIYIITQHVVFIITQHYQQFLLSHYKTLLSHNKTNNRTMSTLINYQYPYNPLHAY